MEFQAKLVLGKKNPRALIAVAGVVGLIVSGAFTSMPKQMHKAEWGLGISFAVLIAGVALTNGNLSFEAVSSQDLVVSEDSIKVGEEAYKLEDVGNIVFDIDGYDGMAAEYQTLYEDRPPVLINGMDNYVIFKFNGEKQEWQFYMPSPDYIQQLGDLFRAWYSKGVVFEERTRNGGRTFMFKPVLGKKDLEEQKRLEGYS